MCMYLPGTTQSDSRDVLHVGSVCVCACVCVHGESSAAILGEEVFPYCLYRYCLMYSIAGNF